MPSTSQWSASTVFTSYTVRYIHQPCRARQPCALLAVADHGIKFPCFLCSGIPCYDDYLQYSRDLLAFSIGVAYYPYVSAGCAAAIAADVINTLLVSLNTKGLCRLSRFSLHICVAPNHAEVAEEAQPRTKGCATIDSLFGLIMDRAHREIREGDCFEAGWKESDHDCVICMEEIDNPWGSLTMPCSHEFHEKCLLRWLDDNNACPLCRFKLPDE